MSISRTLYNREWRHRNKDKVRANRKRYDERHRDRINEQRRKREAKNRSYYNLKSHNAYLKGREKYLKTAREKNRKIRLENAMTLFDKGIVLPQKIAAALGMRPSQLRKQLEEVREDDFMSLLNPLAVEQEKQRIVVNPSLAESSSTESSTEKTVGEEKKDRGAPLKDDSEISEEGAETRASGANKSKGGK